MGDAVDPEDDPTRGTGNGVVWMGGRGAIQGAPLGDHIVAAIMATRDKKDLIYPLNRDQTEAVIKQFDKMLAADAPPTLTSMTAGARYMALKQRKKDLAQKGVTLTFDDENDGVHLTVPSAAEVDLPDEAIGVIVFKSHTMKDLMAVPLARPFVEALRRRLAQALVARDTLH